MIKMMNESENKMGKGCTGDKAVVQEGQDKNFD